MEEVKINHFQKKIKLLLVHGFLGSGKTTLLLNLLKQLSEYKSGILMNEIGEISIDGLLIKSEEEVDLIEVNNGSIFCNCKHNQFIEALIKFSKRDLDFLIIEASGISDPSTLQNDLDILKKKYNILRYSLQGNICVVDAENFLDLYQVVNTIKKQIEYATLIIINKIDLIDPIIKEEIVKLIKIHNKKVKIIYTTYCNIEKETIFGEIKTDILPDPIESLNKKENQPLRILLTKKLPISFQKMLDLLEFIKNEIIRLKGFVLTTDGWKFIEIVNGKITINTEKIKSLELNETKIVIIFSDNANPQLLEILNFEWSKL